MELPPVLLAAFPDLAEDDAAVTHPPGAAFNCVAWAAGVTDAWWWPGDPDAFWPPGIPDEPTAASAVAALATAGYSPRLDGTPEAGFEKAAVYERAGVLTHVARQMADGRWSSKLGRGVVVSHATPAGVEGAVYGKVVAYLQWPVS